MITSLLLAVGLIGVTAAPAHAVDDAVITGHVYDEVGNPLGDVTVLAWLSSNPSSTQGGTSTAPDGSYTIPGLPAGEYYVKADPEFTSTSNYVAEYWENKPDAATATRFTLAESESVTRDFTLELGGIIEGTVTNGSTPLAGIDVTIYEENTTYAYWQTIAETTTDSAGEYVVEGLDLGEYAVRFSDIGGTYGQQFWSNTPERASATRLTVGPSIIEDGIDAVLTAGGSLSGTITETTGASTVPSTSSWVEVFRIDSEGELEAVASVQTDSNGDYSFSGLAPGDYTVQGTGNTTRDRAYTYLGGAYYAEDADSVTVAASAVTADVDVDLLRGTTLEGDIVDAETGGVATGVGFVILYERSPGNWEFPPPHGGQGDDMNYRVSGMPPGNYIVYFTDHRNVPDPYQLQYWENKPTQSTATIIEAPEGGEFTGISAEMTTTPWPALTASATPSPASPNGLDGWYTSPVTVTLAAGGGTEVTDSLRYKLDGASAWSAYSSPLTVSTDGTTTITYQAQEEEFQNSPEGTLEIKLDATTPTTSASVSGRNVTLSATDATSGVASVEYQLNGATSWTAYTAPIAVGNAAVSVVYRATDAAGNVAAEKTQTLPAATGTVTVSTTATPATPDGTNGWYKTAPITVTGSGVASLGGSVTIESKVGSAAYGPQASRTVSTDGTTVLTFRGSDDFGNTSSEVTRTIKLDTVAPEVTADKDGRTVTLTATDATSGVSSIEYRFDDFGSWQTYSTPVTAGLAIETLQYRGLDNAGNLSEEGRVEFVAEPLPVPDRISGADRFETAADASQASYPDGASVVYVTTGFLFPDALSAGPAAAYDGGPLLLVPTDSVPASVTAEIERLDPDKIVVIGGTPSVSAGVFTQLKSLVSNTVRISGTDRFDTSRKVTAAAFDEADIAYIATGLNFPDALAAGGAAGVNEAPVILVNGGATDLDAATAALLADLGVSQVKVLGGTGSVSAGVFSDLDALPGITAQRLAGADRFATADLVNADAFLSGNRPMPDTVFLATGFNFPDALAGSAWAAKEAAPLYVVQTNCVPGGPLFSIRVIAPDEIILLGGTPSLGTGVKNLTPCS